MDAWLSTCIQNETEKSVCIVRGAEYEDEVREYFENELWLENDLSYIVETDDGVGYFELTDLTGAFKPTAIGTKVEVQYTFNSVMASVSEIPTFDDAQELIPYLVDEFNKNPGDFAAVGYDSGRWSEEELSNMYSLALGNVTSLACEPMYCDFVTVPYEANGKEYCFVRIVTPYTPEQLEAYYDAVNSAIREIMVQVRAEAPETELDAYRILYDKVCDTIDYDDELASATDAHNEDADHDVLTDQQYAQRGLYGALVQHSTVCSGYTVAYLALCEQYGLKCWTVEGMADGYYHGWNAIFLDGNVYYVDCTFADTGDDASFMFTDEQLESRGYTLAPETVFPW